MRALGGEGGQARPLRRTGGRLRLSEMSEDISMRPYTPSVALSVRSCAPWRLRYRHRDRWPSVSDGFSISGEIVSTTHFLLQFESAFQRLVMPPPLRPPAVALPPGPLISGPKMWGVQLYTCSHISKMKRRDTRNRKPGVASSILQSSYFLNFPRNLIEHHWPD